MAHQTGTLTLWEVEQGRPLDVAMGTLDRVQAFAFPPDGKSLVGLAERTGIKLQSDPPPPDPIYLQRWGLGSEAGADPLLLWESRPLGPFVFSPDGTRAAVGSADGKVYLLGWPEGYGTTVLEGGEGEGDGEDQPVRALAFTPDGRALAVATGKTVRLWETMTGQRLLTLPQEAGVTDLAFFPDGRTLAVASDDGKASLWLGQPADRDRAILK